MESFPLPPKRRGRRRDRRADINGNGAALVHDPSAWALCVMRSLSGPSTRRRLNGLKYAEKLRDLSSPRCSRVPPCQISSPPNSPRRNPRLTRLISRFTSKRRLASRRWPPPSMSWPSPLRQRMSQLRTSAPSPRFSKAMISLLEGRVALDATYSRHAFSCSRVSHGRLACTIRWQLAHNRCRSTNFVLAPGRS